MMKKLLAVLMVLGICGSASATNVSLEGAGTTIVAPPGVVTINILTDADLICLDALITVTGGDVIVDALSTATASAYGWDPTISFDPKNLGTAAVEIGGGLGMGLNSGPVVGFVDVQYTGGTQLVSIAGALGFGGSYDSNAKTPDFSAAVVEIIPEPMTIALLGLGGLFLLRRRK